MIEATVKAVNAVDYTNAGTIEFLMDKDKKVNIGFISEFEICYD